MCFLKPNKSKNRLLPSFPKKKRMQLGRLITGLWSPKIVPLHSTDFLQEALVNSRQSWEKRSWSRNGKSTNKICVVTREMNILYQHY